jgi:hypothetical protein
MLVAMSRRSTAVLIEPAHPAIHLLLSGSLVGITIACWTRRPEPVDVAVAVRLVAPS